MSTRTKRISEADESATLSVGLTVNGRPRTIVFEPRTTLLDALRDMLALSGTKKGCDRGECGACTVHVDGRRVLSCMTLAAMQEGARHLVGHHDFSTFRDSLCQAKSPVKTLDALDLSAEGDEIHIAAKARSDRRAWLIERGYRVLDVDAAAVESDLASVLDRVAAWIAG